ncbi:MAG TPA: 23S rRNA (pseudouridine(1915)-N(3))-methyltransferase RlmH [Roseiarcus sp.]|nr:23S rRNA (pseudouridine(1915)-N(3))-methyltransferase RlmH [Roseiarcus sp.]
MRIVLICVGRLKAGPEQELFARYFKRLTETARGVGIAGVDLRELDESRARRPDDRREEEAASIIAAAPSGAGLIALDERGDSPTSEEWAADIRRARDAAQPIYAVVIGGPDGLSPSLRAKARRVVSFGAMTWPHQLARVMASEQLYRALSILSGHPYHRA